MYDWQHEKLSAYIMGLGTPLPLQCLFLCLHQNWCGLFHWGGAIAPPRTSLGRCTMFAKFGVVDLCAAWIAIGACVVYIGLLCWNGYDDYRRTHGKGK